MAKIKGNIAWKTDNPSEIVKRNLTEGKIKTGDKVLDIGCGFGANTNYLESKGAEVTAINIDGDEIKAAKKKASKLGVAPSYIQANATSLPLPDRSFDVVLDLGCSHMIPSYELQMKAESESARVIKPGGYLIYFGFSKNHPAYSRKPESPMFRNLEDIQTMYGENFDMLSHEEISWQPKTEERRSFPRHVGLNIVMRRK